MSMTPRSLTILGATGSVGQSTLDLVRHSNGAFCVAAVTANSSVKKLAAIAREFNARDAVIADASKYEALKSALADTDTNVSAGPEALVEAAQAPSDIVMAAIVGAAGLRPTMAAVRRGATVALANKECLVCAGDLLMEEVKRHGATLLPVDSEHNAIFQVFEAENAKSVSRLVLTASGGPFRNTATEELFSVTPEQAVAHPNWDMGAKISVDSATMMNKGLEVIEAYYLFPVEKNQIDVVVHPQSVIHSMVDYVDGSTLAQLGSPDMRVPIASCLAWPNRMHTPAERLDLQKIARLDFEAPDLVKFRCLKLAMDALQVGGAAPVILNAANEIAVEAFLTKKIGFMDIAETVEQSLTACDMKAPQSLANVFEQDNEARRITHDVIARLRKS
jgi:1-deoxy-D-xylulose-5-phosphate reductoisomerase